MSQEDNIIIIGAGPSGIIMGCQLQKQLNFTNFEIYEKTNDFGGTWLDNTYPGCGCDVPSHFYSFSFEKKPDWTQLFALQPEIKEYMINVSKKYNLYEHAHFQTECLGAEWNKETERWTVNFKNLKTGKTFSKSCKFLVAAAGILSVPNPIPVPGSENFKGKLWHTSQWNHNVPLENKNVIVIGNGCSATQVIPEILPKVKTISQFIRSPHWVRYKPHWTYTENFKKVMKYVPGALTFYRLRWAYLLETFFKMAKASETGYRKALTEGAEKYIKSTAPEKFHKLLIPKSEVGFKRSVFDTGYLKSLNDEKILLTDDPLVQIKEHSVLTKSGKEYPADVIVCANGFQVHERLMPMSIKGKSGEDMRSRWKRQGGARAYMGVMVADYPNMFIMVGPNTASGHYSMIFMSECNADYAIRLMRPLIGTSSKGSIEVTEEAEKRYVDWIQEKLKDFIWTRGSGWFVDNKNGYNGVTYPHYQTHYWLNTLRPQWSDFKVSGERKKKAFSIEIIFAILFLIGLLLLKVMVN